MIKVSQNYVTLLENCSSVNVKFSKTQLFKMIQSGGVIYDLPIFGNILLSVLKKGTDIGRKSRKNFLDRQIDKFNKEYIKWKG